MSFLHVSSLALGKKFQLNCTSFSTTLYSQISSVQTKTAAQHFPVKAQQSEVSFDLVFPSEPKYEMFQYFIRQHQMAALHSWPDPQVMLQWPERDIDNWTGLVKEFKAGGARRNPVPHAKLTVDLIDSVFATRTDIASLAASFWTVAGYGSPTGLLELPSAAVDYVLQSLGVSGGVSGLWGW